MKISERWLREWTDPALDVGAIAERLTLGGLEVEALAPAGPALVGVVVGEVLSVRSHPDAVQLHVCSVFDGTVTRQVVCGAPNVRPSLKTAYAGPGAVIGSGHRIARTQIRAIDSDGMLCSASELGLGDEAAGIVELPASTPTGATLSQLLELDDMVLDVNVTPNRGDCFSVIGIARDLAALSGTGMKAPEFAPVSAQHDRRLMVELADVVGCPVYAGRVITGIDPSVTTPMWLRERLRRAGLRCIHPVVDITNYVMLELGQPMHAFDLDKLAAPIVVRGAQVNERIVLLDGSDLVLTTSTLVITDQSGPIALAGIMGGAATAVSSTTHNVFLESAFFEPVRLAGTARRYHLYTDAAQRFERGVDPTRQQRAIERATALLVEICGGSPGPSAVTRGSAPERLPVTIDFRPQAVTRLLGTPIEEQRIAAILRALTLEIEPAGASWRVTIPAFRFDLTIEADLVEEVARIHGYDAIPMRLPFAASRPAATSSSASSAGSVRATLSARGFFEAITYSFIDPHLARAFEPGIESVPLVNPISSEMSVLRRSLWPGLVAAARHNLNRQHDGLSLFEIGMVFHARPDGLAQINQIAGLRCGSAAEQHWAEHPRDSDFYDIKQDVAVLLQALGQVGARIVPANQHALHPGRSAAVVRDGVTIGHLGALHPAIAGELGIIKPLFLFEINCAQRSARAVAEYQPISRFPAVRRDLSIIVAEEISAAECIEATRNAAGEFLRDLQLFDVYRGQGIDSGKKSLTLGLIFQALSSTLTDDEVDLIMRRVLSQLQESVGGSLRE